jgi:hypothetical protein
VHRTPSSIAMALSPQDALRAMGTISGRRSGALSTAARAARGALVFVCDAVRRNPVKSGVFTVVLVAGVGVAIFVVAAPSSALAVAAALKLAAAKAASGIIAACDWAVSVVLQGWSALKSGSAIAVGVTSAVGAVAFVGGVTYIRAKTYVRRGDNRESVEIDIPDGNRLYDVE